MISAERLVELREWCQPRPNAVQGVKQPVDSWANLTAALDELIAARTRIAELETAQLAREDRAYYDGAKAYRSMVQVKTVREKFSPSSHQEYDLTEADTWLHGGCAGRREVRRRLGGQTK